MEQKGRCMTNDAKNKDNVYAEFIKSLRGTDKEFVRQMLEEYERTAEDE